MEIRQAHSGDVETIVHWRAEAACWIAERGFDQWSSAGLDDEEFRRRVSESVHNGETWMAVDRGELVGTIAIDHNPDPGLWSREEQEHAVIVHRMIVPRFASGRGVGALLLLQAERIAEQRGRMYIRLDAWTSNTELHDYYRNSKFRYVRTVNDHHTPSAALFERRVWSVPLPAFPPTAGTCDP